MENKAELNEQQETKTAQGWGDVVITPDIPLIAMINFFNILNQRLVAIEDNYHISVDGKDMTLTELYKIQAEAQAKAQEADDKKGE